ncbi:MAG TPA: exodeoxyribonuclease VII large subunit [Solirubrobacteraceae bacterium]|nr:exodeoxyribonuclease VII large subunit [Solirubrobacteraceae bacterium]
MAPEASQGTPQGIPGSRLAGPFAVGRYAAALRERLRSMARVQLIGELVNLRLSANRAYFELRDEAGAVPCSAWRSDWETILAKAGGEVAEGTQVVVAGGPDYYAGSAQASPSFSFSVTDMRLAGEGDLLAQVERLRRVLRSEGLLEPQKLLPRAALPRTVAVVTAEGSRAQGDIAAALERRGWRGRLVWAFTPVQDRRAAPQITAALGALAGSGEVDVIVVARGGGSVADLLAFSDETLCRTVALLAVPVVASVGHHYDHTLLDDVAAVSCSTPTHAAEAAVPVDCGAERERTRRAAAHLSSGARRAILQRARHLALLSRAPASRLDGQRTRLHQMLRELRASSQRSLRERRRSLHERAASVTGRARVTSAECRGRRRVELERLALALDAHDVQRTLERGYVLASRDGEPVTRAAQVPAGSVLALRFADGERRATVGP